MTEPERTPEEVAGPLRYAAVRPLAQTWGLWLANVSVVVGLLGVFFPLVFPIALPCAIAALVLSRRSPEPRKIRRRALEGLIVCMLGLALAAWSLQCQYAAYGPWGVVRQAKVRSELMRLDEAIEKYISEHDGAPPADLAALADFTADPDIPFMQNVDRTGHKVTHYHYMVGLDDAAPAKWIRVYADPSLFGGEGGAVLCVDGTVELLDEPEFGRRLNSFVDEYRAARGAGPVAITPR